MNDESDAASGHEAMIDPRKIADMAIGVGLIPIVLAFALDRNRIWDAAQVGAVMATGIVVFWYTWETRLTRLTTQDSVQLAWAAMLREGTDARLSFEYAQFRLWRQLVTWTGQKYEGIDQRLDRWARQVGRDSWFVHAKQASSLVDQLMALAGHLNPPERAALHDLAKNYLDGEERLTKAFGDLQDMPRRQASYTTRIHDAAGNFHACLVRLHGEGAILSGWLARTSNAGPAELSLEHTAAE